MTTVDIYRELHAGWMIGETFFRPTHIAVGTDMVETGETSKLIALVNELHREEITARWLLDTNKARFSAIFTTGVANGTWKELGLLSMESDTERITDGGLEIWASDTNLTHWTEVTGVGGSVNKETTEKYSGAYSAKVTGGSAIGAYIGTTITLAAGRTYKIQGWMKKEAGNNYPRIRILTAGGILRWNHNGPSVDGESEFFTEYYTAEGDETVLRCWNYIMGGSSIVYYDAVSIRESGSLLARAEEDSYCTKAEGQVKVVVVQLKVS